MPRLISLDDPRARDERVAGAKAAGLARARGAGLPVLPGWILPSGEAGDAAAIGAEALARSGPAAAVLAVAGLALDESLLAELEDAAHDLGGTLIVRSSTSLDGDARWTGAFATYHRAAAADLPAAVLGCWASAFTRDAVERAERMRTPPAGVRVAVLLQPWVGFELGGTASLRPGAEAVVAVSAGGPAGLAAGRAAGTRLEVASDGTVGGVVGAERAEVARRAAALAADVARTTGDRAIEWGEADGEMVLLQTRALGAEAARAVRVTAAPTRLPAAESLARSATRFPAPLGETFVLAWAGLAEIPVAPPIHVEDPRSALAESHELVRQLTSTAWAKPEAEMEPRAAARRAADTIRAVLGDGTQHGLDQLATLRPFDPAAAVRLLGLLGGLADAMVRDGRLPHRDLIWRLTPGELERAVWSHVPPPVRLGPDRWEPFVRRVVEGVGRAERGSSASAGTGAGRLAIVDRPGGHATGEPRRVLALAEPVPHAAPLLWGAAAVVTSRGGLGAHLFEVARSLGVPAVAGVDLLGVPAGTLVAVDGDDGTVWVWDEPPVARSGAGA